MAAYKERFQFILSVMEPGAKEFAAFTQDLHDAEVLDLRQSMADRASWSFSHPDHQAQDRRVRFLTMSLKTEDTVVHINYLLRRPIEKVKHQQERIFSLERSFWLYDEIQIDPVWANTVRGVIAPADATPPRYEFQHSVLFSDGMEYAIPFSDVFFHATPLSRICEELAGAGTFYA